MAERAGRTLHGADEAAAVTLEAIRFYSREHARLHRALVAVIVGEASVRDAARAASLDRASLAGHARRFRRMIGLGPKGQRAK